jgi:hypothetical protein
MKRLLLLVLVAALTACAAPVVEQQSVLAPPEPTQTPIVIIETVLVEPTQIPTQPAPPEPVVITVVVEATQAPTEALPPTQPPAADMSGDLVTVDNKLGAGWFVEMTRNRNDFSLRCQLNKEITFSVKPTDPNIAFVDFYYRIQDRSNGAVFDWQNVGRMLPNADGTFSLVFSGEKVKADFRKPNAWFDYQFIGVSRMGGVVGRSEKIMQQVTYTFDCP